MNRPLRDGGGPLRSRRHSDAVRGAVISSITAFTTMTRRAGPRGGHSSPAVIKD